MRRYCLKFSTTMTTKVYCVRQLKSSLAYLVSNPLNTLEMRGEKLECNVTLLTTKVYPTQYQFTSLAYLVSNPLI